MTESKKLLMDVLTRYEALQDIKGSWQEGVIAIERLHPTYRSNGEDKMLVALKAAIELLDRSMDVMAGYDQERIKLRRVIDEIPKAGEIQ